MNHSFWPGSVVIKQLSSVIRDEPNLTKKNTDELEGMIMAVSVFKSITESCEEFELKTWHDIASLTDNAPNTVLQALLNNQNVSESFETLLWKLRHLFAATIMSGLDEPAGSDEIVNSIYCCRTCFAIRRPLT